MGFWGFGGVNNTKYISVQGPTEYVLSDEEFENGINVVVEYFLVKENILTLQCQAEIPFQGGQMGYNGEFFYFYPLDLNPFISSGYEGPYYLGTGVCSTKCEVPIESGVLYANQPEYPTDFKIDCAGIPGEKNYFRFYPISYADPCFGGGYLRTHVEANGSIYVNEIYIPGNTALSQTSWELDLPLDDQGNECSPSTLNRGFCLFEGIDVYGVEILRHLIAPYCDEEQYVPIIDSDNDGIPNDEDPCPYVFGVFCDDEEEGEEDVPIWNPGGGCIYLFEEEHCLLNVICDGSSSTINGTITNEFHSGSEPCFHCFSADICRIPDPLGGPDYVSIVGNINNGLTVAAITNSSQFDCVCGYGFYCGEENTFLGANCIDEPCQDGPPSGLSMENVCHLVINNNSPHIALQSNEDNLETSLQRTKISKEDALSIIMTKERKTQPSLSINTVPNPSSSEFELLVLSDKEGIGTIQIFNVIGESLFQKKIDVIPGKISYRVDSVLTPGIYYVALKINGNLEQTIKHVVY